MSRAWGEDVSSALSSSSYGDDATDDDENASPRRAAAVSSTAASSLSSSSSCASAASWSESSRSSAEAAARRASRELAAALVEGLDPAGHPTLEAARPVRPLPPALRVPTTRIAELDLDDIYEAETLLGEACRPSLDRLRRRIGMAPAAGWKRYLAQQRERVAALHRYLEQIEREEAEERRIRKAAADRCSGHAEASTSSRKAEIPLPAGPASPAGPATSAASAAPAAPAPPARRSLPTPRRRVSLAHERGPSVGRAFAAFAGLISRGKRGAALATGAGRAPASTPAVAIATS